MANRKHDQGIRIVWEFVEDPNVDELLIQVVRIIFKELQTPPENAGIDKLQTPRLNEEAPAESANQTQPQE